jgi:hypothetical protein
MMEFRKLTSRLFTRLSDALSHLRYLSVVVSS